MSDHVAEKPTGAPPEVRHQVNDPVPPELTDFEILKLIGQGTFGQVWLGKERVTGVYRAIKVFPKTAHDTEMAGLSEFQRRNLQHPNLVQVFLVGQDSDSYYVVMELADDIKGNLAQDPQYYEPCNLDRLIKDRGALPPLEALKNLQGILEGIDYLHGQGLIHRDIKPSNVLLVNGQIKLCDFGLLAPGHQAIDRAGTHGYWRPDGPTDRESDLYAVTKVAFEMFTGADVSKFSELPSDLARVTSPEMYRGIRVLLEKGCSENPSRRFSSAQAMLGDIGQFFKTPPHESTSLSSRERKPIFHGWASTVISSLAVLVLLVVGLRTISPVAPLFEPLVELTLTTFPDGMGNPSPLSKNDPKGLLGSMTETISTNNPNQKPVKHPIRYAKLNIVSEPECYIIVFWVSPSGYVYMRDSRSEVSNLRDPRLHSFRSLDGDGGNYVVCSFLSDRPFLEVENLRLGIERLASGHPQPQLPPATIRILKVNQATPELISAANTRDDFATEGFGLLGQIRAQYGSMYKIVGVELPLPRVLPAPEIIDSEPPTSPSEETTPQEESSIESDNSTPPLPLDKSETDPAE